MLKAFRVGGKQCYVIRPEVQQVRYSRCRYVHCPATFTRPRGPSATGAHFGSTSSKSVWPSGKALGW